jgi:hypothetical protein
MCLYLHLTGYRPGMIDPHPVARTVNVAGGPLELGAQFVLTKWHVLEKKPAHVIGFSQPKTREGDSTP